MTDFVDIVRVMPTDLDNLQGIATRTFTETFAATNTEENLNNYLEQGFSKKQLQTELDNPDSVFYFAVMDTDVIGYLKLNRGPAQTENKLPDALEIERLYVVQSFHGKNIGRRLLHKALQHALECHVGQVWLGVWEKNLRAIRFYQKYGFQEFDQHVFILGNDRQTDILMKLSLHDPSSILLQEPLHTNQRT